MILRGNYQMSGEFGNDFVTISDEEGNDFFLEHIDTIELDGIIYTAFVPADMDEDDDDYGMIIFKVTEENGEELLATIDDDDLLEYIYGRFMERILDEEEE